jgi:hypothetical protein
VVLIPLTIKFKKLLRATKKFYGKKKGIQIAHAIASKKGWKH